MPSTTSNRCASPALPRLAFVYHPYSVATIAIASAASGVCELVWVIDTAMPEAASMSRLLARLGVVVDVAEMSVEEAASAIAAADPHGILAYADDLLVWTARVAALLGLPFHSANSAECLSDKYLQRAALQAGGLPVPGHWAVPSTLASPGWDELARAASFPAVLKPREGGGNRGVTLVGSLDEVRSRLVDGSLFSALRPVPPLLIEEYLADRPADERGPFAGMVSVESIVSGGRISHLAITGRFPLVEPFRETGSFIPHALNDRDRDQVLAVTSAAIAAVSVTTGGLHTEIKLTPDGPRVVEINGRVGIGIPDLLSRASGFELLPISMRVALGEPVVIDQLVPCNGVAAELYAHAPMSMRRVSAIDGLEELRAMPGVEQVLVNRHPGQNVDHRDGNFGHVFSVRVRVANHEQLAALAQRVHAETRIRGD